MRFPPRPELFCVIPDHATQPRRPHGLCWMANGQQNAPLSGVSSLGIHEREQGACHERGQRWPLIGRATVNGPQQRLDLARRMQTALQCAAAPAGPATTSRAAAGPSLVCPIPTPYVPNTSPKPSTPAGPIDSRRTFSPGRDARPRASCAVCSEVSWSGRQDSLAGSRSQRVIRRRCSPLSIWWSSSRSWIALSAADGMKSVKPECSR